MAISTIRKKLREIRVIRAVRAIKVYVAIKTIIGVNSLCAIREIKATLKFPYVPESEEKNKTKF